MQTHAACVSKLLDGYNHLDSTTDLILWEKPRRVIARVIKTHQGESEAATDDHTFTAGSSKLGASS